MHFNPVFLVQNLYTVHVVVYGGQADLAVQFKGRVLLHQFLSLRSID